MDHPADRVVRRLLEAERRPLVGLQVEERVDPGGEAQDALVEVVQPPRIAPREQDRESGDEGDHEGAEDVDAAEQEPGDGQDEAEAGLRPAPRLNVVSLVADRVQL
jgi:hypothetical protein